MNMEKKIKKEIQNKIEKEIESEREIENKNEIEIKRGIKKGIENENEIEKEKEEREKIFANEPKKIKCPTCRGAKMVLGLGSIIKVCKTCNGEGEVGGDKKKYGQVEPKYVKD